MTRNEFIGQLLHVHFNLGLSKEDFVILSGGSLLLRGLRSTTRDIDIAIRPEAAERGNISIYPVNHKGLYMIGENCEAGIDFEKYPFDTIDGYQVQTLESILEYKRLWQRAKDVEDIKIIEKYLAQ